MRKYFFTILATLLTAPACASASLPLDACASVPFSQSAGTKRSADDGFSLFKKLCYTDASGSYVLHLLVDKGNAVHKSPLSDAIQLRLFKLTDSAHLQSMARDAAAADEAGIEFLPELIDVGDIDGDGLIDPNIVYRFYTQDADRQDSAFSGRIKIITFYKGQKVAIRAITGMLDGSRSTTASANFFKLPKQAQGYLVKKMKQMYDKDQFGFDNSFGFNPRRE